MATPDWAKKVVALIKWGKREHLEKLVRGELYLNTPEYYRINADKSFGDKFESCAYSYRAGRDDVAPVFLKDGVPLSHFRTTSATVYTASKQSFYLHCWSMISAWDGLIDLKALAVDLQRQREQLGPCFVALRSRDIGPLLERIQEKEPDAGCSHIEYSDDPNQQSCVCKHTQFAWQREFRFLVGDCSERETHARRLQLGDLSNLLLFNGTFNLRNKKTQLLVGSEGVSVSGL